MKTHSKEEIEQSERTENIVALTFVGIMLLVVAGLLTNGFGYFNQSNELGDNIKVPYDSDPIRGDSNDVKVVIYIFSDFECPFCAKGETIVQRIYEKYSGKVALVFKNYPLTQIHPDAFNSALAAECANEQGKFWEYHDFLFAHQNALSVVDLKVYAKEVGLNQTKFDDCFASQKYAPSIKRDMTEAQEIGITSTPTFIVNGQAIVGSQPEEAFDKIILAELAK